MEFKLPNLGENIDSGDITGVLVNVGDIVAPNQDVLEVETGKAVVAVPLKEGGKITKILVKAGDTVNIGAPVFEYEPAAASASKPAAKPAAAAKPATAAKPAAKPAPVATATAPRPAPPKPAPVAPPPAPPPPTPAPATAVASNGQSSTALAAPAGPEVRRLARELGVDLSRVAGSGADGRILREDVIAAVRHANLSGVGLSTATPGYNERDGFGPILREPLSRMRKTIAANMVYSVQTIPQLTNFDDADVTELERIRKASADHYKASGQPIKLTALAFVIKAVALSLKTHKTINASLDMESGQIIYKGYVNVGVAVDTEHGLMVPVIRDVDRLSIPQLAQAITGIAERAKKREIKPEEMTGGTFTISNLGAIGGTYSTPIINPPEVAILLVGRSRKLPIVTDDGKIEPRLMMPLSLTYDHRLVDGAAAARFLTDVIGYLQSPGPLLLAQ
ncbi:MAG: 2-oxo acid dehydrogenase subunit E2 [Pirellulales bacterium]|nr:2-oxo acid dehydrogenase subunit E2 [Pirellulales bacterium]